MGRRVSNNKRRGYNRAWEKNELGDMVQEYDLVRDTYVVPEIKQFVEPVIEKKVKVKKERVIKPILIKQKISIMQKIRLFLVKLLRVEELEIGK